MKRIYAKDVAKDIDGWPACVKGLARFRKLWSNGFLPTPDNIAMLAEEARADRIGMPFCWALSNVGLLGQAAWADWVEVVKEIRDKPADEHMRAMAEAAIALVLALEDWGYNAGDDNGSSPQG